MEILLVPIFILGSVLAIGRGLDLALWTDYETGLCTVGSVWLRYGILWVMLAAGVIMARKMAKAPGALHCSFKPLGVTAALAGAFVGFAGAARLLFGLTGIGAVVRAALELVCGFWFASLAKSWLRKGEYRLPSQSMTPAVLGTAVFYWGVLSRFMENSSSWHRVAPTATVWQMLAALVFLSALARALYLPETTNGKTLGAGGLASFALCLCWELPQLAANLPTGLDELPEFFFGLGLCCIGALGLVCTLRCAGERAAHAQHSVG